MTFKGLPRGLLICPSPLLCMWSSVQSDPLRTHPSQPRITPVGRTSTGGQQWSHPHPALNSGATLHQPLNTEAVGEPSVYGDAESQMGLAPTLRSQLSSKLQRLSRNWAFWSLLSLGGVGTVAIMSAISLFRIPNLPNCRAIFWPTASAATRIQCAEAYSEEGSVDSLLAAHQIS